MGENDEGEDDGDDQVEPVVEEEEVVMDADGAEGPDEHLVSVLAGEHFDGFVEEPRYVEEEGGQKYGEEDQLGLRCGRSKALDRVADATVSVQKIIYTVYSCRLAFHEII